MKGKVKRIRYQSDDGSFVVAELDTSDGAKSVVGPLGDVQIGQWVEVEGEWSKHETYGLQLDVDTCVPTQPDTEDGMVAYLADKVDGVGESTARDLVKAFENELFEVLREERQSDLEAVVGPAKADVLIDQWEVADHQETLIYLRDLGISKTKSDKIIDEYGDETQKMVESNPYQLAYDIDGFGFDRADEIARLVGIPGDDSQRIEAAITYAVRDRCYESGHTYLKSEMVHAEAINKLQPEIEDNVGKINVQRVARQSDHLEYETKSQHVGRVYPDGLYEAEIDSARALREIEEHSGNQKIASVTLQLRHATSGRMETRHKTPPVTSPDIPEGYNLVATEAELEPYDYDLTGQDELSNSQQNAVESTLDKSITLLTGGPGTGKTYTIERILNTAKRAGLAYACCAPTGRAAKRMEEMTGFSAQTIHRLLKYHPKHGPMVDNVHVDLLIVDEMSMVDQGLFHTLIERVVASASILFVGDPNQLPSVGPGRVLHDLLRSEVGNHIKLEEVFRQGEGSSIPKNATRIQEGETNFHTDSDFWVVPTDHDEASQDAVVSTFQSRVDGRFDASEMQVLSPQKSQGPVATEPLNERLQSWAQNELYDNVLEQDLWGFYRGDRVIQTENDYDLHVYNGEIGRVQDVGYESLVVDFGDREVEYSEADEAFGLQQAYAITCHKCVHPDTWVETPRGMQRISDIPDQGVIRTPDGMRRYKNKVEKTERRSLKFQTENGYSIEATPEHGIDVWESGKYRRVEASDVKEGNWFRLKKGYDETDHFECIPSLPDAPDESEIDARAKIYSTPREMGEKFAEFLGMMIADGTLFDAGFRLVKRHEDAVDRFSDLCFTLFGYEPNRAMGSYENAYDAEVNSTYLVTWLKKLGCLEPNNKSVPDCIFHAPVDFQKAFLRGFAMDGCVNVQERKGREVVDHIQIAQDDLDMLADIQTMLLRIGIVAHLKDYDLPSLYMYANDANTFFNEIGFPSNYKQSKSKYCSSDESRNHRIPVTVDEAYELFEDYGEPFPESSIKGNAVQKGFITKSIAHQIIEYAVKANLEPPQWLEERLEYHHVRVQEIEESTMNPVCVEVPGGHKFLQNRFSAWNSQGSEFPCIVIPMSRSHLYMWDRTILYTAITRATTCVVMIGDTSVIEHAIRSDRAQARKTTFQKRIDDECR